MKPLTIGTMKKALSIAKSVGYCLWQDGMCLCSFPMAQESV